MFGSITVNGKLLVFQLHPSPPPHWPPASSLPRTCLSKLNYTQAAHHTFLFFPFFSHKRTLCLLRQSPFPFCSLLLNADNTKSMADVSCAFPHFCSLNSSSLCLLSSLHDHKDDIRKRLSHTTQKLEMVETEFDSTRQYLETELRRAQEELEKFTEKLRR